jgi:hypothetical protein
MDLNGWTGKTYKPSGWLKLKITFGARRLRCEYCRLNFAAFRRRKESFSFSRWRTRNPDSVAEKPAAGAAGIARDNSATTGQRDKST